VNVTLFYSHSKAEGAVGLDLCAKDEVGKLCKRPEDNEEHKAEAQQVFSTGRHRRRQLCHCPVEIDELKQLQQQQQPPPV